jgi:hypothetical protein
MEEISFAVVTKPYEDWQSMEILLQVDLRIGVKVKAL